jgi:hypothetical protein
MGGWVGLKVGPDDEKRKFLILPGLELRLLGHPALSYTDCAMPAPTYLCFFLPLRAHCGAQG